MATEDQSLMVDSDNEAIPYLDHGEPVLDVDPPPYFKPEAGGAHSKLLPVPLSHEDVKAADNNKKAPAHRNLISGLIVLLCLTVIFSALLYYLPAEDSRLGRLNPIKIEIPTTPGSRNGTLNFVEKYPVLNIDRSTPECRAAWNSLTEVPCHEAIWIRDWDDGIPHQLGPPLAQFVPLICDQKCTAALLEAQMLVGSVCMGQEAFMIDRYHGAADSRVMEADPSKAMDLLVERIKHMCKKSPINDADRGFCVTDMESRWGIVDGFKVDGVLGLGSFLEATKTARTEPAIIHISAPHESGEWSESYDYFRLERKFGPTRNSTTCSWCTFQWFDNKLGMWDEALMRTTNNMSLPRFLRMWEKAGRRCEGDQFAEIFKSAVQKYKEQGVLDDLWEKQPSGDTAYLVSHGPSTGDVPVSWVSDAIPIVKTHRDSYGIIPSPANAQHAALDDEYISCLETFAATAQDLPCFPFLDFTGIKQHILSSPQIAQAACSEFCFTGISDLAQKIWEYCPAARFARWDTYDRNLRNGLKAHIGFTLTKYFGDQGTIAGYQNACRRASGRDSIPCGAVYAKWGAEDWIFSEHEPKPNELINITQTQLKLLPEMPEELKEWIKIVERPMTDSERAAIGEFDAWRDKMREGVCSDCMWQRFVPYKATEAIMQSVMPAKWYGDDVAMDWIITVFSMQKECRDRGIHFAEQELADVSAAWIKKYSQELWDRVFPQVQEPPLLLARNE